MGVALITRDGAEVRVEDGRGRVTKLEADPGKRNAKVTIVAGHLREPVTGWADGTDAELVAAVRAALDSHDEVPYRIEVVRARDADPSVAIADLPKRSKFRRLVALGPNAAAAADVWGADASPPASPPAAADRPAAAATPPPSAAPGPSPVEIALGHLRNAVLGDEGVERIRLCETFARDLGATDSQIGAARAPRPQAKPVDADPEAAAARAADLRAALKELKGYLVDRVDPDSPPVIAARQRCLELGATVDQMRWASGLPPRAPRNDQGAELAARTRDPDRVAERAGTPFDGSVPAGDRPSVAAHSGLGHRSAPRGLADPPPFKRTYEDGPLAGALNPSSYEVGEVIGLVKLAQRLLIRRARALAGDEGTVVAPTVEQVHGLARALMLAADRVQVSIRGDGSSVDRMSGLYRRATSAVWEAIDWYPYPGPDAEPPAVAGWHAAVVEHAQTTIRVGLELLGQHLPAAPPPAAEPAAPTGAGPVVEPATEGVPA